MIIFPISLKHNLVIFIWAFMMHNLLLYTFQIPYIDYNSWFFNYITLHIPTKYLHIRRTIFERNLKKMQRRECLKMKFWLTTRSRTTTRPNLTSYTKTNSQPLMIPLRCRSEEGGHRSLNSSLKLFQVQYQWDRNRKGWNQTAFTVQGVIEVLRFYGKCLLQALNRGRRKGRHVCEWLSSVLKRDLRGTEPFWNTEWETCTLTGEISCNYNYTCTDGNSCGNASTLSQVT